MVEISDNGDIVGDDNDDDEDDDNEHEMKTGASLTVGELIEAMKTKKKLQISQPSSVVSCVICLYLKNDTKVNERVFCSFCSKGLLASFFQNA